MISQFKTKRKPQIYLVSHIKVKILSNLEVSYSFHQNFLNYSDFRENLPKMIIRE